MKTVFLIVKFFRLMMTMTLTKRSKSWPILVPAVAVIREGQALFFVTGRKESVDGKVSFSFQSLKLNCKLAFNTVLLEFYTEK